MGRDPSGQFYIPFTNIWIPAGEQYGAQAAQFWADKQEQTGNWLYAIPGALASLWTPCTSNKTVGTLTLAYGISSAPAALSNVAEWAENPFWYEVGQKTIPTALYNTLAGLSAAQRGQALVAELGWLRALLPSIGPWATTLSQGPTPGGLLAVFGLSAGSYAGGSNCGCQ